MITQRFAVEFERRTVGIAARVPGGFVFYASDDRFNEMDGRVFPRARVIERQLKKVAKRSARKAQAFSLDPSFA
jgi:hypothetical protein